MLYRSLVVCLLVLITATAHAAERPNVVFILCDDKNVFLGSAGLRLAIHR